MKFKKNNRIQNAVIHCDDLVDLINQVESFKSIHMLYDEDILEIK